MSLLPRSLRRPSLSKLALLTFALVQTIFLTRAMEAEHYDICMQETLKGHTFNHDHFTEPQEGTIPLYDIKQASSDRTFQMHQENMKDFQIHQSNLEVFKQSILLSASMTGNPSSSYWDLLYYPRSLLEVVGNAIPSLGWPSFSLFSTPISSPNLNALDSDNLLEDFHLIEGTSTTSTTVTTLSIPNIDTSQDWSTKGADDSSFNVTNPEFLGLSLDGGGVRGLMMAMWIDLFERRTNQPVNKVFDLIGGTSIGGMAALLLTASDDGKTPKMRGDQLADLIEHSERIFPQRNRYNFPARLWDGIESLFYTRYEPGSLENLLKEKAGDLTLGSTLTRTLITAVNADTVAPHIFDSFNPIDKVCKVWEMGLCTSAAPTFFPAHLLSTDQKYYIDGGIAKNNPGLDVLKGLSEMPNFSVDKTAILSLGTGNMPLGKIPANAGISSVGTIVDALIATQSKSVEMTLGELLPNGYSRANPTFEVTISLDQLNPESLALLKAGAEREYGVIEMFAESDLIQTKLERIS